MTKKPTGIKKIAVFRALQLGDLLCAVPAFRALRYAYPGAEIILLGLPWAASFVQRFPRYFDRFIHFPGYPGLPEQPFDESAWQIFLKRMQHEEFDLLLQLQGNGAIVNPMLQQFNALNLAGFHNKASYVDSPLFCEYANYGPEVKRLLHLMEHLGAELHGFQLEFPLTKQDYIERDELLLPISRNKYVVVHPGSRGSWRQWPPSHFAMLADYCNAKGFIAVLTGTKQESEITREVRKSLKQPAFDVTGLTSMGSLAVLLKEAQLLISNCTGVAHMAAAVQTPGVIISMDGESERWGHPIHTIIDWTSKPSLQAVIEATDNLLEKEYVTSNTTV
jgi:ADP-heptose:LPS heptosyltransferase